MLRWLSLTIGWLWAAAVLADTGQTRYTVLMIGKPAGVQTSLVKPDGTHELTYEYNDRGRGPKLTSRQRFGRDGVPVSVETRGVDYLKVAVAETFSASHGVARWKNDAESGERKLASHAYYVSMNAVPSELALLANALLKAPANRMSLLPDGEASLRRTGETTVRRGEANQRVTAYEIDGLGFTPNTVWLAPDGRFFALVSSWISVIEEGWENSAPTLLKQQDELDAKRTVDLATTLTRKPAGPVAIVNANLFDAQTGQSQPGSTVILRGNRIVSVGKTDEVTLPAGAERIDAHGRALLPGLWDMHVHMSPNDGLMHIAAGVTSVRDLATRTKRCSGSSATSKQARRSGPES